MDILGKAECSTLPCRFKKCILASVCFHKAGKKSTHLHRGSLIRSYVEVRGCISSSSVRERPGQERVPTVSASNSYHSGLLPPVLFGLSQHHLAKSILIYMPCNPWEVQVQLTCSLLQTSISHLETLPLKEENLTARERQRYARLLRC